jgi:hypothetical protein
MYCAEMAESKFLWQQRHSGHLTKTLSWGKNTEYRIQNAEKVGTDGFSRRIDAVGDPD